MATDVEINTKVQTADAAKSLTELRKGLKDLISLQGQVGTSSASFGKLRDAINKTENKISDLTTSFQTLRGSGVERLNSSIGIFREGLLNADTGKLKAGMEGIGSAMKAIPIFLLIEGARLLFENWDKVTGAFDSSAQKIKVSERALIDLNIAVNANKVSTDALLITKENELKNLEKQGGSLQEIINKLNEINQLKQDQFRGEIKKTQAEIDIAAEKVKKTREDFETTKNRTRGRGFILEIFGFGTSEDDLKKVEAELAAIEVKKGEIVNKSTAQELNAEQEKRDKIEALRKKFAEAAKKRREEAAKAEQEEIDRQVRAFNREAELLNQQIDREEKQRKDAHDAKLSNERSRAEQEANAVSELEQIQAQGRKNIRNRELAEEAAHRRFTTGEKIAAIELTREIELSNEQLTQDQRVAIIKKAEADILAARLASLNQAMGFAQQGLAILNELNELQNQTDNQKLNDLQVKRDEATIAEQERTNAAINREVETANAAIENEAYSAEYREQIKRESEARIEQLSAQSKNNQLQISSQFSEEETRLAREQFERNKKAKLIGAIVDTASGVVKALGSAPPPLNFITAGIVGAAGAIQIDKIIKSKFEAGASSAPASVGSVGSVGSVREPSSSEPRTPRTFNPTGISNKNNPQKVYVLDRDIKNVAAKVDVIEARATFGR